MFSVFRQFHQIFQIVFFFCQINAPDEQVGVFISSSSTVTVTKREIYTEHVYREQEEVDRQRQKGQTKDCNTQDLWIEILALLSKVNLTHSFGISMTNNQNKCASQYNVYNVLVLCLQCLYIDITRLSKISGTFFRNLANQLHQKIHSELF